MHFKFSHLIHNLFFIIFLTSLILTFSQASLAGNNRWQLDDVLFSDNLPFSIGHRGYGNNLGKNILKPIENTIPSITRAFKEGIQIVEVDVVMTKDKKIIALHDDYLDDLTCVNTLKYKQLKKRLPHVPTLKKVLKTARKFSSRKRSHRPTGQVIIEIKNPSPWCDPDDKSTSNLVKAVLKDVSKLKMQKQVLIESFSPEIIAITKEREPTITTMLTLSYGQLLPADQIELISELPVTLIDKDTGFDLQWAEIGSLFRLPGYQDLNNFIQVLLQTNSQAVNLDSMLLAQMEQSIPESSILFIDKLHLLGMSVLVYTVDTEPEFLFFSNLGVDGIFTNNIQLGLELEGHL